MFVDLQDINLYTHKIHMHDHFVEDVAQYGYLSPVDASAFEHSNFIGKNIYE